MSCTCGNNYGCINNDNTQGSSGHHHVANTHSMDASFIHLPPSLQVHNNDDAHHCDVTSTENGEPVTPANFLQSQQHLLFLETVANNDLEGDSVLCLNCVERVRTALEQDTDRLERECDLYRETIEEDRLRQESAIRAIRGYWPSVDEHNNNSNNPHFETGALLQGYRDQIDAMNVTCENQIQEINELLKLRKEQAHLSNDLDDLEWGVEEHKNTLELEARGFDNAEEQVWNKLSETIQELDQLSSTKIKLPAIVLGLKVDKARGLRYPLINELRLAYRPKGDLKWNEVQAAWSLAAQLLLACGALLQYPSQYWKIVPLSSGAKLIHHNNNSNNNSSTRGGGGENDFKVYNLGHPNANGPQTLLAWNNLMYNVVHHCGSVLAKIRDVEDSSNINNSRNNNNNNKSFPKLPFDMTPTSIGGKSLVRLDKNDDAGWSRVVHCTSCNLLWLSECSSRVALAEVLLETHV